MVWGGAKGKNKKKAKKEERERTVRASAEEKEESYGSKEKSFRRLGSVTAGEKKKTAEGEA